MKKISLLAVMFAFFITTAMAQSPKNYLTETKAQKDTRMAWWREAKFGMFIHWGLYAVLGGEYGEKTGYGEWIMNEANIPIPEYEKFAPQFNPVRFNADEWVRIAKNAGMKYIVITSKHHEGFSMWDSKVASYDIMDRTPFKRDVLKELAAACKRAGIKLGFYYSIMDWHHDKAKGETFAQYRDQYLKPQLKELITQYPEVSVLWFDGEWIDEWTEPQGKDLYNYVRNLKPSIIINNRVGKGRNGMQGMNLDEHAAGDFGTPEQEILEGTSTMDWESCMTMNNHWGWNKNDKNFKSSKSLIHNLIDIAAKGGNYLLNVGPTDLGLIPSESVERLAEMGNWMRINGEAIYGTHALKNYREGDAIRFTQSANNRFIYAHLLEWQGNSVRIRYIKPKRGSRITVLGDNQPLQWRYDVENGLENGVVITLPERVRNLSPYAWVLKMEGTPANVTQAPEILDTEGKRVTESLFTKQTEAIMLAPTENATIHYTLDGSDPTRQSPVYHSPLQVRQNTTIKAIAVKQGMVQSLVSSASFSQVKSVENVILSKAPNPKYAGRGALTLMDGKKAPINQFTDKGWLGWDGEDVNITIDLGTENHIILVTSSFLQNQKSWIFLPEEVRLEGSLNGLEFVPIRAAAAPTLPSDNVSVEPLTLAVNDRFRFLRLVVKGVKTCPTWHAGAGEKCWFFMDEIVVE